MSARWLLAASAWTVVACSPVQDGGAPATGGGWFSWHDAKRDTDRAVGQALNGPGGPDYPRAIAAVRASGRPVAVKDVEVGNLVLSSYANRARGRAPAETLGQGLALLERGATGAGEGARTAPAFLQLYFTRGITSGGRVLLAPDRAVADCWARVRGAGEGAAACVALRRRRAD